MLDNIDTLIGFAVVFTVVSLLITIVVQMATSALNLRGQNLAWAVAETFETINPALAKQIKDADQSFAAKVAAFCALPIVRILTVGLSGLLAGALTNNSVPTLSKKIADHLLTDRLLSDKQMLFGVGSATAVRPEELFDLLHRIATGQKEVADPEVKAGIYAIFAALGISEQELRAASPANALASLQAVVTPLEAAIKSLPAGTPETLAVLKQFAATKENNAIAIATQAAAAATESLKGKLTHAYQKFETWMDTGEERAQEWFTMHAWWVTLIVGAVFAIGLQLDTVEIYQKISTNRALRNQLVAQSTVVLGQAEKYLSTDNKGLHAAFDTWQKGLPAGGPVAKAMTTGTPVTISDQETRGSLVTKIENKLGPDLTKQDAGVAALLSLDTTITAQAKADLKAESAAYKDVKGDLDKTGFALFPPQGGRWETGLNPGNIPGTHWLGIVFSILLLSLGAPFWFNLLKSLGNLRSAVASNIATEDQVDAKHGSNPPPGTPPASIVPTPTTTTATR